MASSSSAPQSKGKYHAFSGIEPEDIRRKVSESTRLFDVFINHRGPDSKHALALPLYDSLKQLGIRAFLDLEEMELGHSFPSTIETAIRSAAVHIAIFSKRYAESPWCLAELVLMLQSPAKIIPVFFEVEPWALRHVEKGVYAGAFIEYKKKSRYLEKLGEWKKALQSISFTTGHEIKNLNSSDCEGIISAVQRELQRTRLLHVAKYPVALDKLVQDFERRCLHNLMQDFEIQCGMNEEEEGKAKIVGIFGMGGVGKTTLSKELFNRKSQQFARTCFLFDVREASAKSNLSYLQTKLLKDLFGENRISFQCTEEGSNYIFNCIERSSSLSFLIVLDDIDHLEQLDALSIMHMLKKPGNSLIIITTRDVGVLVAEGIKVGYHLKGMNKDDARELFSWHAFSKSYPASGYEGLVDDFLGLCGGLPLSLQVLGRHVHGRDESYWRSELKKLGTTMHQDIRRKLKISFDALNAEEKQIFMDMACFFVYQPKSTAISVWKASGWSAQNGLQTLKDKCLVEEIIECHVPVLRMHDHLRDLGREMANELSHPRRLWLPQDLKNLESKGLENIFSQSKGRCFHSLFDSSLNSEVKFFLREAGDEQEISSSLIWLYVRYPYSSSNVNHLRHQQRIRSWIPLQNLQSFKISNGHFKRLWQQDVEAPPKLKELEIDGTSLEEFPDFLGISTNVEKEVEKEIEKEVEKEIEKEVEKEVNDGQHMCMKLLRLVRRRRVSGSLPTNGGQKFAIVKAPLSFVEDAAIKEEENGGQKLAIVKAPLSFVEDVVMREQENITRIVINGNYCPSLRSLELSCMQSLLEVQFTRVKTLNCVKISKCEHLQRLIVASDLTYLEELSISACPQIDELCLGDPSYLKKINIADTSLESVPGISSFRMLVELNISRCSKLHELNLAHLRCLEKVIIKECDYLKSVTGISHLQNLVELSIFWCWALQLGLFLVGLSCLKRITLHRSVKVKCLELNSCKSLETVSGISFQKIRVVNICHCPELRELPVIRGASCLEGISINGCKKLNNIMLADCGILKRVSGNFDPIGLSISDCPLLEELPCFRCLTYLEKIHILRCGNLKNMSLPTNLKSLELNACIELKNILATSGLTKLVELNISDYPELELGVADLVWLENLKITNLKSVFGISNLSKLVELKIRECVEIDLELSLLGSSCLKRIEIVECGKMRTITVPTTLIKFTVERCRKLQRVAKIGNLTQLTELYISMCPELRELPDLCGLSCLEKITTDGCGKLNSFRVTDCVILKGVWGMLHLDHLAQLWISDCPALEELPSFARLTCLKKMHIFRCGNLREITLPETLKNLQLESCKRLKCMQEISRLKDLVELIIFECWQLELPLQFKALNSLQSITIDRCSKLKSFQLVDCQNLKRVSGDFNVESLSICKCPELEELSSLGRLSCLKMIYIDSCEKLQSIMLPMTLMKLRVQQCKKFLTVAGMDMITELHISGCPELEEIPNLARLSCLKMINIGSCDKLHSIILPMTLMEFTLQKCIKLRTVTVMDNPTELIKLFISDCPELMEIPNFSRLSCLKMINIDYCDKLQSIILPMTLMKLSVQRCKKFPTLAGIVQLTELHISGCPELEEIPNFAGLRCLQMMYIDSCDKLHNLILPMSVMALNVQRCRNLETVGAMGSLRQLTELYISQCPELEELLFRGLICLKCITVKECERLKRLHVTDCMFSTDKSRLQFGISDCVELEEICIFRCKNLERITLATALKTLHLDACPDLMSVSKISDLKNLVQLIVSRCCKLDVELNLQGMNSLQNIEIGGCLRFYSAVLNRCPNLKKVSLSCKYSYESLLSVCDCHELEFLSLGNTLGVSIFIYACEKLVNVKGMEESQALKSMQFLHRSNASIHYIFKVLGTAPPEYIQIIGRAADGAESILYPSVFSEASFCTDEMQALFKWMGYANGRVADGVKSIIYPSRFCTDQRQASSKLVCNTSAIIACAVVEVNSSVLPFLEKIVAKGFQLQQGELIITTVITKQFDKMLQKLDEQFEDFRSKHRIMKKWCAGAVKIGEEWRTLNVLRTIIDKLHQK